MGYGGELASAIAKYRDYGHKEAAAFRPPSDATNLDPIEDGLRSEARGWLSAEQKVFDGEVAVVSKSVFETRRRVLDLSMRTEQLLNEGPAIGAVDADLSAEHASLVAAAEARMRAEVDWRHFRETNRITEQASYPESKLLHFGWIAVAALIETLINAFFYENTQGLLGGFVVALSVAAVNMGAALMLGIGFRYKNLAAAEHKVFGWTCLLLFAAVAIYFNALFSAFRAEYQLIVDPNNVQQLREAFAIAISESGKIFLLKMRFLDLMSFILFGVGIILSLYAFYKGYTLDDKYPGHGQKDRKVKDARASEQALQEVLRQRLKSDLLQLRSKVQATATEPGQISSMLLKYASEIESARRQFLSQAQSVQRDFALVLNAYREANTAVRASPAPGYFENVPDLLSYISHSNATSILDELKQLQEEATQLREKYQESLNQKLRLLQDETSVVLTKRFSEFLKEVEEEAHLRVDNTSQSIQRAI